MEQEILARVIQLYVLPARRHRLMGFLHSQKRYSQLLDELLHDARHIDSRILHEIPSDQREVDKVAAILRQAGVQGEAYLVGHCGPLEDGTQGDFYELLKHCCGSMTDSLVFSIKSEIAYYEGHEGFRYLYGLPSKRRR